MVIYWELPQVNRLHDTPESAMSEEQLRVQVDRLHDEMADHGLPVFANLIGSIEKSFRWQMKICKTK